MKLFKKTFFPLIVAVIVQSMLISGTVTAQAYETNLPETAVTTNVTTQSSKEISTCTEIRLGNNYYIRDGKEISPTVSYTYLAKALTPSVTVKNGSRTLKKDTDYTVTYYSNNNVGTATAIIRGKGSYTGLYKCRFSIVQRPVSRCSEITLDSAVFLSGGTSVKPNITYPYDGNPKMPSVTVTQGTKTFRKGIDYTVTYSNNVNAGTATAIIKGKKNLKGSYKCQFRITPQPISKCTEISINNQCYLNNGKVQNPVITCFYTGNTVTPSITIKNGETVLQKDTDYTVTYSNNIDSGKATAKIIGKGNFYGEYVCPFDIIKAQDTTNENQQNYIWYNNYQFNYSKTVRSYLSQTDGGYLKFVPSADDTQYHAEYYSTAFQLQKRVIIGQELPIFGGFYAGTDGYYIVSGQKNLDESDDVEIMRVTRYDTDWKRISSASVYGADTIIPFCAGSLRIAEDGDYLIIKTCHQMYKNPKDGKNHQANMCFQYSKSQSRITDSFYGVVYAGYGYSAHSFNQFVQIENHRILTVDHCDAYPRSVLLNIYNNSIENGTFIPDIFKNPTRRINLIEIPGDIGANFTGTTIGGFEYSRSAYLTVGSVIDFNQFTKDNKVRNIFVSSVDKNTFSVTNHNLTNYTTDSDITASTPQLVKLSPEKFLILWSTQKISTNSFTGEIYYALLDENGQMTSALCHTAGCLSDCQPVALDDTVLWYTQNQGKSTFYSLNTSAMTLQRQ